MPCALHMDTSLRIGLSTIRSLYMACSCNYQPISQPAFSWISTVRSPLFLTRSMVRCTMYPCYNVVVSLYLLLGKSTKWFSYSMLKEKKLYFCCVSWYRLYESWVAENISLQEPGLFSGICGTRFFSPCTETALKEHACRYLSLQLIK